MLATEDVKAIKTFIREGYRDSEIARQFKVSRLTVRRLRLGQTHKKVTPARSVGLLHKHTPAPAPRPSQPARVLTDDKLVAFRDQLGKRMGIKPKPTNTSRGAQAAAASAAPDAAAVQSRPTPAQPGTERPNAPPAPTPTPVTALDVPTAAPLESEHRKAARLRHSKAVEVHAANKKRAFWGAGELEETEREVTAAAAALKNALS